MFSRLRIVPVKMPGIFIHRVGIRQRNLSKGFIEALEFPLPPPDVQREIVARVERERAIIEGNRELVRIYEEKIKKVIERVWES